MVAKKEAMEVGDDRISFLPDAIIHHILSSLPKKFAARTSILSKRWESLWATFPTIDLDEEEFEYVGVPTCREKFLECMQLHLWRHDFTHLQKLRISTLIRGNPELHLLLDQFVDSALMRGNLQQLDLNISSSIHLVYKDCRSFYVLPQTVFSSGKFLVSLILHGCRFEDFEEVNFPLLKTFSLSNVHMTEEFLFKMISGCHAIETLSLAQCHGVNYVKLSNKNIKHLALGGFRELETIEIDVPNLNSFTCNGHFFIDSDGLQLSAFNNFSTKVLENLYNLSLSYLNMSMETFHCMIANSPNLESLCLERCRFSMKPLISGENLKKLTIRNCTFEDGMQIVAPNLQILEFADSVNDINFTTSVEIGFQSLTTLSLAGNIYLTDDALQYILTNCPVLVSLTLERCHELKHLNVVSEKLERLEINECPDMRDAIIEAPNLVFFKFTGRLLRYYWLFTSPLLSAEIHLKEQNHYHDDDGSRFARFRDLLQEFGNARSLSLVSECPKCIIIPGNKSTRPPLHYLSDLKVKTKLGAMGLLNFLSGVLNISFCHESIFMDLGSTAINLRFERFEQKDQSGLMYTPLSGHNCIREHLVGVSIEMFEGSSEEMQLVKFLLSEAVTLMTMSIAIGEKTSSLQRGTIMDEINNYVMVSPTARIVFC